MYLSAYTGEIPRRVEPNFWSARRSSSRQSSSLWYGMQMVDRSLIFRFSGVMEMPWLRSFSTSPHRCSRSMTMPGPMTFTAPWRRMPEGIKFKMNLPRSLMTVCPALLPP